MRRLLDSGDIIGEKPLEAVMQIRRAEVRDIDRINELLYQVAELHHNLRPDIFMPASKKYSDDELAEMIRDDSTPIFVAEDDGVVGYAFCIFRSYPDIGLFCDHRMLYIDDICVDESQRGKHIGTKLYEYVRAFAKEQGCYHITLNVWTENESARRFYEALGMKQQRTIMEDIL